MLSAPRGAQPRQAEPRIAAQIWAALGDARTVVNVGAGTGYEPPDRDVTAVEPSTLMRAQRPSGAAPCVAATAGSLPFEDQSFDAAMAVSTIHHWQDPLAGLQEMRRVAAGWWCSPSTAVTPRGLPGSGSFATTCPSWRSWGDVWRQVETLLRSWPQVSTVRAAVVHTNIQVLPFWLRCGLDTGERKPYAYDRLVSTAIILARPVGHRHS